ncbi:MAG: SPOCS domain-containing protein [Bacillota bacterium]
MVGTVAPGTERLRVNQVISENTTQTVVRGTVTVPDPKPDVEKILSTDKSVKVKNVQIVPDKVIVNGTLTLQIVYVAFEPAQSVHHMHQQINFTTFVDVPGALPGMKVDVDVTVEDISVVRQTGHPRNFDVTAVLEVSAKVSDVMDIDVVTQCPEGCTCETEEVTVDQLVGSNRRQVMISDEFDVPEQKPPVEKVLDADVKVEITNTKVLKNKVIVDGTATVTVTYVGALPDQPVHSLHRTFKFSDFVDVPGAQQGMDVNFDIRVESVDVDTANAKCDRLRVDMVLGLTANVVEPETIRVITELSNCPNVSPTFTELRVDSLIGENTSQLVLKDTFETPDPKPDVEKILDTTVDKVTVTETKILKDKVIVSGKVDVQIVYVAAEPDQSVHAMHRTLPFRTFVEVMGAREGADVDIDARAEFATASAKGCEITVEVVLKVTAKVTRTLEIEVLTSVTPVAPPTTVSPVTTTPCPPGSTFEYVVKQGDTLYSIGRKYGVSLNEMKAVNPQLPDPNNIKPGMVINVPCVPKG